VKVSDQLVFALSEARIPLGPKFIQSLRKDFLMLMRNLKRAKTWDQLVKLRAAFHKWSDRYEEFLRQLRRDLEARGRDRNPGLARDAKYLLNYVMSDLWSFNMELRGFPLELSKQQYNYRKDRFDPAPTEDILRGYKADVKKWEGRIRRLSRKVWKHLDQVAEWQQGRMGGSKPMTFKDPQTENVVTEGFKVQIVGADLSEHPDEVPDMIKKLQKALRLYKRRARRVFPLLLKKQLPFKVYLSKVGRNANTDVGASHEGDHIAISEALLYLEKDPRAITKTLAHEMGHNIFGRLSRGAKTAWRQLLADDLRELDLRDVLAKLKPGESMLRFKERIKKSNPTLYLQLDGLYHSGNKDPLWWDVDKIRKRVDSGNHTVLVRRNPITAYANKNHEEAFCETVGMLVAYGPKTLPDQVIGWLKIFFPRVRVEHQISDEMSLVG
jgi:hypothetical protein